MTNPMLTLTMFKKRTADAKVKSNQLLNVYGSSQTANAAAHLTRQIEISRVTKDEFYWSFARYIRNHTKDDITDISAVTLSFPYSALTELRCKIETFPFVAYLIHAKDEINAKRLQERLVLAVPFDQPITSTSDYARIASLLSNELGIKGHKQGDFAATFLFAPFLDVCSQPKVTLFNDGKAFLNAEAYLAENKGVWTDARSMQEGSDMPVPASTPATQSDDLFQW